MRIDSKLNLVFPIETDSGEVHVFSTPVGRAVFERYFLAMARAFAMVFQVGGGIISAPKIASLCLREAAVGLNAWEGPMGVEAGLVAEIRRLTNVVMPAPGGGWEPVPLMDAGLDEEDLIEVESVVTFFTLSSAMQRRAQLATTLDGLTSLLGAQTTSLGCSAWIASSLSSTATAISSAPAPSPELERTSSPAY